MPDWTDAHSFHKVGVTGSREGPVTVAQADIAADLLQYLFTETAASSLHHGDCVGVDEWAVRLFGNVYWVVAHPPADDRLRAFVVSDETHDPHPYLQRNREIVDSVDLMIALPKSEDARGGTGYTIRYARGTQTDIVIVYPDGSTLINAGRLGWNP